MAMTSVNAAATTSTTAQEAQSAWKRKHIISTRRRTDIDTVIGRYINQLKWSRLEGCPGTTHLTDSTAELPTPCRWLEFKRDEICILTALFTDKLSTTSYIKYEYCLIKVQIKICNWWCIIATYYSDIGPWSGTRGFTVEKIQYHGT